MPSVEAIALHSPSMARSTESGRVEVLGIGRERRRGRVLDALVDREDREVPGPAQASVIVQRAEVAQHRRRTVGEREDVVQIVRSREGQELLGERGGLCGRAAMTLRHPVARQCP